MLEGKITDYGDLIHQERWLVKGRRLHFRWHIGRISEAPRITGDDGVESPQPQRVQLSNQGVDVVMDLPADMQVALSGQWTDEVGNPTTTPPGASVVYTVDNAALINLTDNGDGTAIAAATGTLGTANVHAVANAIGFPELTADLQIVVVAGLAERFNIVAGTPTEVTPDEPTP